MNGVAAHFGVDGGSSGAAFEPLLWNKWSWLDSGDGRGVPGAGEIRGLAEQALIADEARYAPIAPPYDLTLTDVEVAVKTGAGTVLRIAVVEFDPATGNPKDPGIVGQTTVDPSTPGAKSDSVSWELYEGRDYWVVSVCDGTPTMEIAYLNPRHRDYIHYGGSASYFAMGIYRLRTAGVGTSVLSDPVAAPVTTDAIATQFGLQHAVRFGWDVGH